MQKMSKLKEIIENNFDSLSLSPGKSICWSLIKIKVIIAITIMQIVYVSITGDLCPPPHGNFTFSDLPIVKRKGQTDHVSVTWTNQVDQCDS